MGEQKIPVGVILVLALVVVVGGYTYSHPLTWPLAVTTNQSLQVTVTGKLYPLFPSCPVNTQSNTQCGPVWFVQDIVSNITYQIQLVQGFNLDLSQYAGRVVRLTGTVQTKPGGTLCQNGSCTSLQQFILVINSQPTIVS